MRERRTGEKIEKGIRGKKKNGELYQGSGSVLLRLFLFWTDGPAS